MYTVLCVDDHIEDLSSVFVMIRKALNVDMITATSYEAAKQLLSAIPKIDAFVLDIELSDERSTGIQLANHIRSLSEHTNTPIIFVSMYSHYSRRLLSTIQNSAFLTKPLRSNELLTTLGSFFGIADYMHQHQEYEPFRIPIHKSGYVEISPRDISYIEVNRNELTVQYIHGEAIMTKCVHGCFKTILDQIEAQSITHLRQIYRSIIINIDQVKEIEFKGNIGTVILFGDPMPKPVGSMYKHQLSDLL